MRSYQQNICFGGKIMKVNINLSKILLMDNKDIPTKFELLFNQDTIKLEQLISKLNQLYPPIDFNASLIIINGKIINDNQTQIHHGDDISFFPPVMGG